MGAVKHFNIWFGFINDLLLEYRPLWVQLNIFKIWFGFINDLIPEYCPLWVQLNMLFSHF